jgi:hypothetical protein
MVNFTQKLCVRLVTKKSMSSAQEFMGVCTRLERFCMGKFQTQKLIRSIVRKGVYTY